MFDTEKFISEIQSRPCLYDMDSKEYSDRELKTNCWYEIGSIMYSNWNRLDAGSREDKARELLKKWKAVRDCFVKDYRARRSMPEESDPAGLKKKSYVYYDQLQFLLPYLKCNRNTSLNVTCTKENNSSPVSRRSRKRASENRCETDINQETSADDQVSSFSECLENSSTGKRFCKRELETSIEVEFERDVKERERSVASSIEERINSVTRNSNKRHRDNPIENGAPDRSVLTSVEELPNTLDASSETSQSPPPSIKREVQSPNEFVYRRTALPSIAEERAAVQISRELREEEMDSDKYGHKSFLISFVPALYNMPFHIAMQIRSQISSIFAEQFGRSDLNAIGDGFSFVQRKV